MFIRDQWIKNTQFEPAEGPEVLRRVLVQVEKLIGEGKSPIVVFDLDSTLFEVSHRSYNIVLEWIEHPASSGYPETLERLKALELSDFGYSLQDLWEQRGIPHHETPFDHPFKQAKQFWKKRFFSNEYLRFDQPLPGAVDYVNRLYQAGAQIVYLTGRDVPLMAFGTYDQLERHGLPINKERTRLILKPKRRVDDLEFKGQAAKLIQTWGPVVASFENEPKNLVAMAREFSPETLNVFMDSVASDHPAPAGKSVYRISEFKL